MRLVVKRRELTEPGQLQALVIDHVDGIEPGLTVLDSRLLLGQATIDVVGLDAGGGLVLMAVGAVADEQMLLRAVEAYSWCLEYPEAICRLYPSALVSPSQPPRLVFVVERMPDAFHRKIKQLGFPQVDCVEFRYLDVDGTEAVYFAPLARLRRGAVAPAPALERAPERAVPPALPVPAGRPTSVKLQKLLGGDRPATPREPAQVVSLLHRTMPRAEIPKAVVGSPAPRMEIATAASVVDVPAVDAVETDAPDAVIADVVTARAPIPRSDAESLAGSVATTEPVDQFVAEPVVPSAAPAMEMGADPAPTGDPTDDLPESVDLRVSAVESVAAAPTMMIELEPILASAAPPEPNDLELEPSPRPATAVDAEPIIAAVAEPLVIDAAEPAPAVTAAPMSPAVEAPVMNPTPSVFARRAVEPATTPDETKVSFAHAAKDLLSVASPTPRTEPAAAAERPSVDAPSRAVVEDLVSGTGDKPAAPAVEERVSAFSAFSKPSTLKRPRTIAPPPPDPQPIAAGPKLGAASTRPTPPAPAAKSEATPGPAPEPQPAQPAPPQGFEGLQFPNDGVLTRQWMEFLNQMAAGK